MTLETTLGEKYAPVATRIEQAATVLAARYDGNIPRDDLAQEMWLALLKRADNPVFTCQPVNAIVNKLAWEARSYARIQFKYMNRLPKHSKSSFSEVGEWEYIAVALNPYDSTDDTDDKLTAIDMIDKLMAALADRPRTLNIARSLLEGRSKLETARYIGIDPSTITYHIRVMRKMLTGTMIH